MRLYVTPHGRWAGTQANANELSKEDGPWQEIDVPTDKPGLMKFLNQHRVMDGRPVVIEALPEKEPGGVPLQAPVFLTDGAGYSKIEWNCSPPYTTTTLSLDEQWEALPLARKLHYAALAMEDARVSVIERREIRV